MNLDTALLAFWHCIINYRINTLTVYVYLACSKNLILLKKMMTKLLVIKKKIYDLIIFDSSRKK
jgi:hypothetical protein